MDTVYWIWLSLCCGECNNYGSVLLDEYKNPKAIYGLEKDKIGRISGMPERVRAALGTKDLSEAERIFEYCQRENIGIMTLDSPIYPERLKRIFAKPLVLYYKGRIPDIDCELLIACVGMRKCSDNGAKNAYRLGAELGLSGAIVVSGMARGIDGASARGALSVNGRTIAVLGSGIDVIYPPEHKELYGRIIKNGAVITEYAPGTAPEAHHFPERNRLISGLSHGVCVVEAGAKSGALITADCAANQGREVFAFPGNVLDPRSEGTNGLIKNGGKLVCGALDVLREYQTVYPHKIFSEKIGERIMLSDKIASGGIGKTNGGRPRKKKGIIDTIKGAFSKTEQKSKPDTAQTEQKNKPDTAQFSDMERAVYTALSECSAIDEIKASAEKTLGKSIGTGELLAVLTSFEIEGVCKAAPGGSYELC